jgi:hypothetical protein
MQLTPSIVIHWALLHWRFCLGLAATLWIFNAAVTSLPSPNANCGAFYRWVFGTLHVILGVVTRVLATLFPFAWAFLKGRTPNPDGFTKATARPPDPAP